MPCISVWTMKSLLKELYSNLYLKFYFKFSVSSGTALKSNCIKFAHKYHIFLHVYRRDPNYNLLAYQLAAFFLSLLVWIASNSKHFTRTQAATSTDMGKKNRQRYRIFLTCIFECKLKWYIEMFVCIPFLFLCCLIFIFLFIAMLSVACIAWLGIISHTISHWCAKAFVWTAAAAASAAACTDIHTIAN